MHAPRKTRKVRVYATLRPLTSDIGPHRLGASPWNTRYEVIVRFISSGETEREAEIVGRAGK